ncbi:MAG: hypothetical protein LBJ32_03835 [Oscillospiraceae bacterium]|nr:hypothetical protein [Oscillospiraceae bacterium]
MKNNLLANALIKILPEISDSGNCFYYILSAGMVELGRHKGLKIPR